MHFEDETEFFGFVPCSFLQELCSSLEETITHTINNAGLSATSKKQLCSYVLSEFRKNFLIFENFSLQQIFTFPKDFSYERKITDLVVEDDIDAMMDELMKLKDEQEFYKNEARRYKKMIANKEAEIAQMTCFLENVEVNDLLSNSEFLKKLFVETKKAVGGKAYTISGKLSTKFNELMENKDIKSETKKKEINELYNIGTLEDIKAFRDSVLARYG
ncbi:hypothetical protein VCUG_00357 [Vavraia culicis subsp. floridensis]|uniref:Uncharacterized protein n=1 Tax=Vavraia culicis (isolate floridensis) TaxID=948595 RepID=L2GWV5_VAVCU|nr:uncharacterized protein VCUG_00357 [Vavraia culicis subsp. floridensis]ELA48119.1 hypothetical protein VCUG_00357 [Vavraia culicis subsp. floridensis]